MPGQKKSEAGPSDVKWALAFANTAGFHALEDRKEGLRDWESLLTWLREAEVVTAADRKALAAEGEQMPGEREQVFARTLALRDALQSLFSRIARNRPPSPADLALLNDVLTTALPQMVVSGSQAQGYAWHWRKSGRLDRFLWPLAHSAATLLTSPLLSRVRECSGRDCSRLFIDESRNGSRRWCTMEGCGNRAKQRRFYRKSRKSEG